MSEASNLAAVRTELKTELQIVQETREKMLPHLQAFCDLANELRLKTNGVNTALMVGFDNFGRYKIADLSFQKPIG